MVAHGIPQGIAQCKHGTTGVQTSLIRDRNEARELLAIQETVASEAIVKHVDGSLWVHKAPFVPKMFNPNDYMSNAAAFNAVISRCDIKIHPSWANLEDSAFRSQFKQTVEVSEDEYAALSIQDHFKITAPGLPVLYVCVEQKSDLREWCERPGGYFKKFLITLAFLPAIE